MACHDNWAHFLYYSFFMKTCELAVNRSTAKWRGGQLPITHRPLGLACYWLLEHSAGLFQADTPFLNYVNSTDLGSDYTWLFFLVLTRKLECLRYCPWKVLYGPCGDVIPVSCDRHCSQSKGLDAGPLSLCWWHYHLYPWLFESMELTLFPPDPPRLKTAPQQVFI